MKDRQHHVWRFYLEAWSENSKIWFSQDGGEPRRTNNKNVAAKRRFYEITPLTVKDLAIVKGLVNAHPSEILRNINSAWLESFEMMLSLVDLIKRTSDDIHIHEQCDQLLVEAEEDMHSKIEDENIPRIEALRNKNTDFANSQEQYFRFLFFVSLQCLRTKAMQDKFKKRVSYDTLVCPPVENPEAIWSRSRILMATSVAASMFCDGSQYNIKFLVNKSSQEFITCDQPVVNLKNNPQSNSPPNELVFYYPLSPWLALLLTNDITTEMGDEYNVNNDEVDCFNKMLSSNSGSQIFASSKESLTKYM